MVHEPFSRTGGKDTKSSPVELPSEPERVEDPVRIQAVESNIARVKANQVWSLGYTGTGLVVANIDTGVRFTHQALVTKYRGNLGGGQLRPPL